MIVPVSPSQNPPDAPNKVRVRKAKRHARKLLRRIEKADLQGNRRRAKYNQRLLLASFNAKLAAVISENRKLRGNRKVHKTRFVRNAEAVNAWRGTNEAVRAHARVKANGSFRPIQSYGIQRRALHRMLRSAVGPFVHRDPRQYATGNGGRDAAVARIQDGLRRGLKWFVRLDIVSFYENVDERRIIELVPAPRGVVLNTLRPARDIVLGHSSRDINPHALRRRCRKGLSQGASSSPVIAEMIVAWILEQIPADAFVINFADDFAIMARTRREAVALSLALASAVRRCPFGQLQLEAKSDFRRVSDGFTFLGYDFRHRRSKVTCRPSLANEIKFLVSVGCSLRQLPSQPQKQLTKLERYVRSWCNAFSQWDGAVDLFAPRSWVVQLSRRFDQETQMAIREALGPLAA